MVIDGDDDDVYGHDGVNDEATDYDDDDDDGDDCDHGVLASDDDAMTAHVIFFQVVLMLMLPLNRSLIVMKNRQNYHHVFLDVIESQYPVLVFWQLVQPCLLPSLVFSCWPSFSVVSARMTFWSVVFWIDFVFQP